MRRSTALDPVVARELAELDAVLAGERTDPVLELIADEARASAEPMPPGLALRLEAAVAEGFPKPSASRRPGWLRLPPLAPALGGLAAVVLALVVAVSALDSGGVSRESGPAIGGDASGGGTAAQDVGTGGAAELSAPATVAVPPTSLPQAAAEGSVLARESPARVPRRVRRAANLTIATPVAKLQDTSDEVTRTVDRLGGYVQRSDVSARGKSGQATFDLRIPAARLDEALATLSRLGRVRARTQQSEDITARFTSARSRLHDARAERQALLRALAEATTSAEIDSIKARLDIARSRIAAAKGDLLGARRAATMARVSVTVVGVDGEEGGAAGSKGDWTPGRALEDAVDVLSVSAGVAIVAVAGAIPAGLLALLALLAWRVHRRRRRELALGPPGAAV